MSENGNAKSELSNTRRWNSVRSQQPDDADREYWPFGSELRSNAQDALISRPPERADLKIKPNEVYLAYAPRECLEQGTKHTTLESITLSRT
jgi:hypothetical protein